MRSGTGRGSADFVAGLRIIHALASVCAFARLVQPVGAGGARRAGSESSTWTTGQAFWPGYAVPPWISLSRQRSPHGRGVTLPDTHLDRLPGGLPRLGRNPRKGFQHREVRLFLLRATPFPVVPGVMLTPRPRRGDFGFPGPAPAGSSVPSWSPLPGGASTPSVPIPRPAVPADPRRQTRASLSSGDALRVRRPALDHDVWELVRSALGGVHEAKTLHRTLFQQLGALARRDSVELFWGSGALAVASLRRGDRSPADCSLSMVEQMRPPSGSVGVHRRARRSRCRFLAGLSLSDRACFINIRHSLNDGAPPVVFLTLRSLLRTLIRAVATRDGRLRCPPPAVRPGRRQLPFHAAGGCRTTSGSCRMRRCTGTRPSPSPTPLQAVVTDAPSILSSSFRGHRAGGAIRAAAAAVATNAEAASHPGPAHHSPGVTVQGSTGTGNVHTYRNIIIHYVATETGCWSLAERNSAEGPGPGRFPPGSST